MRYDDRRTPCSNCPFRRDVPPYLRSDRVQEILDATVKEGRTFACHKTLEYDDEGEGRETARTHHCVGALIMLERMERPNQMMRIAERLGLYDRRKLAMDSPVYATPGEMWNAHARAEINRAVRKDAPRDTAGVNIDLPEDL